MNWHFKNKYFLFFSILLAIFLGTPTFAKQAMRIAILKSSDEITINGDSITVLADGKELYSGNSASFSLSRSGETIKAFGVNAPSFIILGETLKIKDQIYSEQLTVICEKGANKNVQMVVIHDLPLEQYLAGTVAGEVPHNWPSAALEAQAIVARTFAIWKKYQEPNKIYHMGATVIDQVYNGHKKNNQAIQAAVERTKGQVVVFQNKPIEGYFHSACGDKTASAKEVWGSDVPYLRGVPCGFCQQASKYRWNVNMSESEIRSKLKASGIAGAHAVSLPSTKTDERPKTLLVETRSGSKNISASKFRMLIGYNQLPSAWIVSEKKKGGTQYFSGRGYGHGVGMCQWGAYGMAKAGFSAADIIAKYYPGTEIRHMY